MSSRQTEAAPGRALRVGVTGSRSIGPAERSALTGHIAALLRVVAERAARDSGAPVRLELFSPLAEGADRLVAELALDEGFSLVCPLPFAQAEYERDFADPGSVAAFRALLGRAGGRVLALDGGRGDDEARSYEAVGRLIVRNADLVIGVWNGRPGKGAGGTAETIRYCASFGPPVVWFNPEQPDVAPRWIEEAHDLRHGAKPRAADSVLAFYLDRLLEPPPASEARGPGLLHAIGNAGQRLWDSVGSRLGRPAPPSLIETYLEEQPHASWGPWRLHGWVMRTLSGRNPPWTPPRAPEMEAALRWFRRYETADARSSEYAARYRSSYVWAVALGAVALSAAAVSLAFPEWLAMKTAATVVEVGALGLIFALVVTNGLAEWQRRSIEYRLLAELCRKQQSLAPLAWVVPRAGSWATTEPVRSVEKDAPPEDDIGWVPWLFSAWLRDTPLPYGTIDAAWVAAAREQAARELIQDQIDYHKARLAQSHRAGLWLIQAGEILFLLVLALVAIKLWLLLRTEAAEMEAVHPWLVGLGLAGAILPAFSAAFVGLRAYAEMELLADQSQAMLAAMERAREQIAQIDPAAPLASQSLGSALAAIALLMLEDLEGWARLFRAKVVEA